MARVQLADAEGLPAEVYGALAKDEAREVVVVLAQNRSTPRDVLEEIASRDQELSGLIDLNPNAAPNRKERAPTWKHSQVSLERYFDELNLAPRLRRNILDAWLSHEAESLGSVRARCESV